MAGGRLLADQVVVAPGRVAVARALKDRRGLKIRSGMVGDWVLDLLDSGAIDDTVIEDDVKLDNQIQIGHNCQVGKHNAFAAQVGIAGSARIGDRVVLAGQCGVNDNIFVGDDVICGGATKVFTNAPAAYSKAVVRHLGLHRHFAAHLPIEAMLVHRQLRPKPSRLLLKMEK